VKKRPVVRPHLITRVVGPFANGSFVLGHSLISAIDALALAAQRSDDHRVTVSGYASSAGTLSQNRALSRARARVVAAHLRAACADRHFSVAITAVGRGVGSASTPAANRVVDVTLH
jgi:outer membrane protein OmpA-like peptidoglycan-associated protein